MYYFLSEQSKIIYYFHYWTKQRPFVRTPLQNKQTKHSTMTPAERHIEFEWVKTLVGLRMTVPNHWWPGYKDNWLYQGQIDVVLEDTKQWLLLLDDEGGPTHYRINWNAVCE